MNNEHQIFDSPMPEDRNFHWLKAKGLEYVQQLDGTQWTNFNDSDPGVTILEQLCYALTELGYCNNFPIEDILIQTDGEIKFQDQFYLPDEILTCSPVTINDYRRLIIDAEPLVKNVYIELEETFNTTTFNGCYCVYLHVNGQLLSQQQPTISEEEPLKPDEILQKGVYELLNQHRNLGELFQKPFVLSEKKITLTGNIRLTEKAIYDEVLSRIQLALDNYISQPIRKFSYPDMQALGLDSDEIFNGPRLNHGWIPTTELAHPKATKVSVSDLAAILITLEGIRSVSGLKLQIADIADAVFDEIAIDAKEIGQIKPVLTIDNNHPVAEPSPPQQLALDLLKLQQSHQEAKVGAAMDLTPDPPQGRYRDIESYYSIQNTFPPFYAIGTESLPVDSPNYRVAQSRQLKGYLMVFDQLLANQFSQLAHISDLFSFKEASTIAPKQGAVYDGIPYQLFSPTYYCQPLYRIPDVKPLLLGNDSYRFGITLGNSLMEEERIWQSYQADPFNQYIQGLRQNMESDTQRDDRRNRMLDHLLARHGEPAALYDELISTARWYGSTLKTRIIIKSIMLQNLASLSYNRTKAHSILHAERLGTPGRYRLSTDGFERLPGFNIEPSLFSKIVDVGYPSCDVLLSQIYKKIKSKPSWDDDKIKQSVTDSLVIKDGNAPKLSSHYNLICDGQLNLRKLEAMEQLQPKDFDNYSTVELQINLVLGLRQHYELLAELLIELIGCNKFEDWLNNAPLDSPDISKFTMPDSDITVEVSREVRQVNHNKKYEDQVLFSGVPLLRIEGADTEAPLLATYQAHLEQIQWLATQRRGLLLIETLLLLEPRGLSNDDLVTLKMKAEQFYFRTLLIFPDYVSLFGKASFQENLEKLASVYWPVHIKNNIIAASFTKLNEVIPAFIDWHNSLRHANEPTQTGGTYPSARMVLAKLLLSGR